MERDSILYKIRRCGQAAAHKVFSDEMMCRLYSRIIIKKKVDLKNPKTFNEKIQWMKLYYYPKNKLVVLGADKYRVRFYVEQKGLERILVPLLGHWDNPDDIDWSRLPEKFVLKCNHGCAYNILCSDQLTFDKKDAVKRIRGWMREDFGAFNIETHYSRIKPYITCEEYLGDCITDYKFFCFNGEPKYMYVSSDLIHDRQAQIGFFYLDGKKMPLVRDDYASMDIEKLPDFFEDMKHAAEILCEDFPFVRVDFFVANGTYYFAELTFTPGGGMMPFNPDPYDLEWGNLLDIDRLLEKHSEAGHCHNLKRVKRIAIIGHFGGNEHFTDGQTVKTLNLYSELSAQTDWEMIKIDTYYKNKTPLKLLIKMFVTLLNTKKVIILLSGNGMKFFFPVLHFFAAVKKTDIYHDVIGGNLAHYIVKYPKYRDYLNSFRVNWVETEKLQAELENQGITNAAILPNFRRVKLMEESELQKIYEPPFHFCIFSRVTEAKGIEDAIKAVETINSQEKRTVCCLDIYGPIDENYKNRFQNIMKNVTHCISYCGEVSFKEAVPTLKKYYATLFPTRWEGEGQAGTITESFFAGIPVIATDWHCNKEMIWSGYNGILYPGEYAEDLKSGIYWIISQNINIFEIKKNCLKSAKRYLPDMHIESVINIIEGK